MFDTTHKHTGIQTVTCLQNILKFLQYLSYGEKFMLSHTIWAPYTYKKEQAVDDRASSKGTDYCSALYTQLLAVWH